MKIGFEVFLVVAREMSITKAANELHITQQCASDHIKRLEKEYNVVLFERRPKFRLTQAGEIMLHNLLNIQIMETSMSRSLAGIAEGTVGGFTLGISTSRAPIILPRVLPRYYQCYPEGKYILYGGGHTDPGGTPVERTGRFIYRGQYVTASGL